VAKRIDLVIIDPQHDFCDPSGALYVKGADDDMKRLANFIKVNKAKIENIHVTLDSHQLVHIAHPIFWKSPVTGKHPVPFEGGKPLIIDSKSLADGVWTTTKPSLFSYAKKYVETLEANKRYPLCIWPPHCLIGTPGAAVYAPLMEALLEYAGQHALINWVTKGSNWKTEHYSAIQADVPDDSDHSTKMNVDFLRVVNEAHLVLLAGEAGSHCLANTGRDACNYFKDDSFVKKLVTLKDATSPVPFCEKMQDDFFNDMVPRGMQVATTDTFQF
jgi:nicotinamidase/pyrazinamidase